jgi:hypothetical protein
LHRLLIRFALSMLMLVSIYSGQSGDTKFLATACDNSLRDFGDKVFHGGNLPRLCVGDHRWVASKVSPVRYNFGLYFPCKKPNRGITCWRKSGAINSTACHPFDLESIRGLSPVQFLGRLPEAYGWTE